MLKHALPAPTCTTQSCPHFRRLLDVIGQFERGRLAKMNSCIGYHSRGSPLDGRPANVSKHLVGALITTGARRQAPDRSGDAEISWTYVYTLNEGVGSMTLMISRLLPTHFGIMRTLSAGSQARHRQSRSHVNENICDSTVFRAYGVYTDRIMHIRYKRAGRSCELVRN